ncbi:MAG: hypothetical protein V1904_12750 [Bacteroidota bacterium]
MTGKHVLRAVTPTLLKENLSASAKDYLPARQEGWRHDSVWIGGRWYLMELKFSQRDACGIND